MFSGPGISAFLQPIRAAGTQAAPAQAIAALPKVGDEPKRHDDFSAYTEEDPPPPEVPPADATATAAGQADDFAEDHTELSIDALRGLLAGKPVPDDAADVAGVAADPEASPAMRQAAAAYLHAKAIKPPPSAHAAGGFVPPPRDQATAGDILLMLAEIEAAGVGSIAVRDGAAIYDTLAALCWSLRR